MLKIVEIVEIVENVENIGVFREHFRHGVLNLCMSGVHRSGVLHSNENTSASDLLTSRWVRDKFPFIARESWELLKIVEIVEIVENC